jgi:hypothetical protein
VDQGGVEGVIGVDAAGEEIEAQPAPLILMHRLIFKPLGGEGLAKILGLNQLGPRHDRSDGLHRLEGGRALIDDGAKEIAIVATMRIPVTV